MNLLYKLIKPFFLKHFLLDEHKHTNIKSMVYAFTDTRGRKYYSFSDKMSLPLERWTELNKYISLYGRGLSSKGLDDLLEAGEKQLEKFLEGTEKVKACAAISTIFSEMKWRKGMIIPIELFYNFFAVQVVREDENPETFDNTIQMEKVSEMKEVVSKYGSSFFLHKKELRMLYDFTTMSESEWTGSFQEMQEAQLLTEEVLRILSPSGTYKNSEELLRKI